MRNAIEAGTKCIDHGRLLDDATAKLMADKGIWWSLQPFTDDRPSPFPEGSPNRRKQFAMFADTDAACAMAKKYRIKTAWGTDTLFDAEVAAIQGSALTKMVSWHPPPCVGEIATGRAEDRRDLTWVSRSPLARCYRLVGLKPAGSSMALGALLSIIGFVYGPTTARSAIRERLSACCD